MIRPLNAPKLLPPDSHLKKSQTKYQESYYRKLQKYSKLYIGVQRE